MDQFEFSAHLEEMERVAARQKAARFVDHRPVGICLNCGAKVEGRFCDLECQKDHDQRERFKR